MNQQSQKRHFRASLGRANSCVVKTNTIFETSGFRHKPRSRELKSLTFLLPRLTVLCFCFVKAFLVTGASKSCDGINFPFRTHTLNPSPKEKLFLLPEFYFWLVELSFGLRQPHSASQPSSQRLIMSRITMLVRLKLSTSKSPLDVRQLHNYNRKILNQMPSRRNTTRWGNCGVFSIIHRRWTEIGKKRSFMALLFRRDIQDTLSPNCVNFSYAISYAGSHSRVMEAEIETFPPSSTLTRCAFIDGQTLKGNHFI